MPGMKAKSIKSIISNKISRWLDSIENETLRRQVSKNVVVTGGCIASMLAGEEVNDFDVYLRNYETAKLVAEYYLARFKARVTEYNTNDDELYVDANPHTRRVKIVSESTGVAGVKPFQYFEEHPEESGELTVAEVMDRPDQIMDAHEETEALAQTAGGGKYRPVFITSNAITLSDKLQIPGFPY